MKCLFISSMLALHTLPLILMGVTVESIGAQHKSGQQNPALIWDSPIWEIHLIRCPQGTNFSLMIFNGTNRCSRGIVISLMQEAFR